MNYFFPAFQFPRSLKCEHFGIWYGRMANPDSTSMVITLFEIGRNFWWIYLPFCPHATIAEQNGSHWVFYSLAIHCFHWIQIYQVPYYPSGLRSLQVWNVISTLFYGGHVQHFDKSAWFADSHCSFFSSSLHYGRMRPMLGWYKLLWSICFETLLCIVSLWPSVNNLKSWCWMSQMIVVHIASMLICC